MRSSQDSTSSNSAALPSTLVADDQMVSVKIDSGSNGSTELKLLRLSVHGMTCSSCEQSLISGLKQLNGVHHAFASAILQRVEVRYLPGDTLNDHVLVEQVIMLGYEAELLQDEEPSSVTLVVHSADDKDFVQQLLAAQPGVRQVSWSAAHTTRASRADSKPSGTERPHAFTVEFDLDVTGPRTLMYALVRKGMRVTLPTPVDIGNRSKRHQQRTLIMLIICALLSTPAVVIELALPNIMHTKHSGVMARDWLMFALGTPVQGFVWPFYVSTYRSLRYSREVTMDALLVLSTTVGFLFSFVGIILEAATDGRIQLDMFFDMNAMLVTFFLLGRYLHGFGKHKATRALSELKALQVDRARMILDPADMQDQQAHVQWVQQMDSAAPTDAETLADKLQPEAIALCAADTKLATIDVRWVQRRDELLILAGDSVPVDGLVLDGSGDADESLVTGEAVPVEKRTGTRVMGGTRLVTGALRIRCTKTAAEGTLADIARLIESAQSEKISVQKLADRIATIFCPTAIGLAVLVFCIWLGLSVGGAVDTHGVQPVVFSLNFFISVLVVACPCAVSLAVPTVLVVATGLASRLGVLVRDGNSFEIGAKITDVVFDKTGTLTEGVFSVVDTSVFPLHSNVALADHALVGAAATASRHPVSRALTQLYALYDDAEANGVTDVIDSPGKGYTCRIKHSQVSVGKLAWVVDTFACDAPTAVTAALRHWVQEQEAGGYTAVVAFADNVLYAYALEDRPRENAAAVVRQLHTLGKTVHLVSGDNMTAVQRMANRVGIPAEHAHGACLPSDKVEIVRRLQQTGAMAVFVGDGVNDAPVLTQSHLGVALSAGAEVTMEAARAVLLRNDLSDLLVLLDMCRAVIWRIRINFAWAFAYNTALIPSAAGAFYALNRFRIPPAIAGFGSVLSVLPVIAVSLLLRTFYRPPRLP